MTQAWPRAPLCGPQKGKGGRRNGAGEGHPQLPYPSQCFLATALPPGLFWELKLFIEQDAELQLRACWKRGQPGLHAGGSSAESYGGRDRGAPRANVLTGLSLMLMRSERGHCDNSTTVVAANGRAF